MRKAAIPAPVSVADEPQRGTLRFLWGLAADALAVLYTALIGPIVILSLLLRVPGRVRIVDFLGRLWCRLILLTSGARVHVEGLEHLRPGGSYVLACNHQSNFDVWALAGALPLTLRFVAKKELLRIPIFGQALALSPHIVIDRANPQEAIARINRAVERFPSTGIGIVFFAEGTRSADGRVQPFKKGAATLALQAQIPLLPVSISGTRQLLPKKTGLIRPGGRITIALGPPIETRGLGTADREALTAALHEAVVRNSESKDS